MKRHESLIPLTHEHHHALAQLRKLSEVSSKDQATRLRQGNEFLEFFDADIVLHFTEEECVVLPLVANESSLSELVQRTLREHELIVTLVENFRTEVTEGVPQGDTMQSLVFAMREHIRFEEKVLFPTIENVIPEDLSSMTLAPRQPVSV